MAPDHSPVFIATAVAAEGGISLPVPVSELHLERTPPQRGEESQQSGIGSLIFFSNATGRCRFKAVELCFEAALAEKPPPSSRLTVGPLKRYCSAVRTPAVIAIGMPGQRA